MTTTFGLTASKNVSTVEKFSNVVNGYEEIIQALVGDYKELAKRKLLKLESAHPFPDFFNALKADDMTTLLERREKWTWLWDPNFIMIVDNFLPFSPVDEKVQEKLDKIVELLKGKYCKFYHEVFTGLVDQKDWPKLSSILNPLNLTDLERYMRAGSPHSINLPKLEKIFDSVLDTKVSEDITRLENKIEKFNALVKEDESYKVKLTLLFVAAGHGKIIDKYRDELNISDFSADERLTVESLIDRALQTEKKSPVISPPKKLQNFEEISACYLNDILSSSFHKPTVDQEYELICIAFNRYMQEAFSALCLKPRFHYIKVEKCMHVAETYWKDLETRFEKAHTSEGWFVLLEIKQESLKFLIVFDKSLNKLRKV